MSDPAVNEPPKPTEPTEPTGATPARRRAAPVRLTLMGIVLGLALYATYLLIGALP